MKPDTDVLYQDNRVCILKPNSKRGIEVFHRSEYVNIVFSGLYSMDKLREVNPSLSKIRCKRRHDDTIFFKAPYNEKTDTIEDSFGIDIHERMKDKRVMAFIKIDPDKTFVYSSEIRVHYWNNQHILLERNRISFRRYMEIIKENKEFVKNTPPGYMCEWNIFDFRPSYRKIPLRSNDCEEIPSDFNENPMTKYDISKQSEILVRIPHIPLNWMTRCVYSGVDYLKPESFAIVEYNDKEIITATSVLLNSLKEQYNKIFTGIKCNKKTCEINWILSYFFKQ